MIEEFKDDNRWLSNFHPCKVTYDGITYKSSEAAYQASKTTIPEIRELFKGLTGAQSKKEGKKIGIRPDWEDVKDIIMFEIVLCKFLQNKDLQQKLIDTGEQELVEGNWWGDQYWGMCRGEGKNKLGLILMCVRRIVKNHD